MTEKDKEIQELRRELAWLLRSEAVRSMYQKDAKGRHLRDICGLDRCIKELHRRAAEAERKAQSLEAENLWYRRRIEALEEKEQSAQYPIVLTGGGSGAQGKYLKFTGYQPQGGGPLGNPPSGGSAAQDE